MVTDQSGNDQNKTDPFVGVTDKHWQMKVVIDGRLKLFGMFNLLAKNPCRPNSFVGHFRHYREQIGRFVIKFRLVGALYCTF